MNHRAFNLALLAWARSYPARNPTNVATARHWVEWCAERALAACVTFDDYDAVAECLTVAMNIITSQDAPPTGVRAGIQ